MNYIENPAWSVYYRQTDEKKRKILLDELVVSVPDDGANDLRKKLYDNRYTDPKRPGKRVDRGVWEMVVIPSMMSGFFASRPRIQQFIRVSLENLGITEDICQDQVLTSAVYWEIRNIAKRFYESCSSPKYGRKFFGMKESSWEEKQVRCGRDVWIMSEIIPERFDMKKEMQIFSDAVVDEFQLVSEDAPEIYQDIRTKLKEPRLPFIVKK